MLCFVLQNFKSHYPFLIKTPRYYTMVKSLNTSLFTVFIKTHVNLNFMSKHLNFLPITIKSLYNTYFNRVFWHFFKKIINRKMGLYSNNLFKSSIFHIFYGIEIFSSTFSYKNRVSSGDIVMYAKPIQTLNFGFQKKTFNTFIFFIKNFLTDHYYTHLNFYKLVYGFIFFKPNFIFYPYLNNYYFKVRNN